MLSKCKILAENKSKLHAGSWHGGGEILIPAWWRVLCRFSVGHEAETKGGKEIFSQTILKRIPLIWMAVGFQIRGQLYWHC